MTQRFYQKVSVQVAIISAVALFAVTTITIVHQRSQLKAANDNLQREVNQKTVEIQRLETLLTPFRTIAVQRFAGPDNEALKKLADQIVALDRALYTAQEELASVKVAASYPKLRRILNVRPNGIEVICIGNRAGAHAETTSSSLVTVHMQRFFEALNKKDRPKALEALGNSIAAMPEWPYAYFYRGALSGNTRDFEKVVELLSTARTAEITEPEPLLYEALSLMFLGKHQEATQLLDKMDATGIMPSHVGLISYPRNCPTALLDRIDAISKKLGMNSTDKQ
jgi:hypothetical protein